MLGTRIIVSLLAAYASAACIILPPQDTWTFKSDVDTASTAADSATDTLSDAALDTTDYVDLARLASAGAIERRLRHVLRDHERSLERIVRNGRVERGDFTVVEGDSLMGHLLVLRGDADIRGKVLGNLVTLDGDVILHPHGAVSGEILVLNGKLRDHGGEIGGDVRAYGAPLADRLTRNESIHAERSRDMHIWWPWSSDLPSADIHISTFSPLQRTALGLAGTFGAFVTLLGLGIGGIAFARTRFEVVSNTVSQSFGRSFLVGLVSQMLLMPTFGVLSVGLIVSVVGILLLPFAVVAYVLLILVGVVGGYVAVALAMGSAYAQRQSGAEAFRFQGGYRPLLLGLSALLVLWAAWALLHWVPIAGVLIWAAAFLVTWLAITAGFGAILLSRGGTRAKFAGQDSASIPDQYRSPDAEPTSE